MPPISRGGRCQVPRILRRCPTASISPLHLLIKRLGMSVSRRRECLDLACAVKRRRFPVGARPTRQPLQPEAIGAVMEVTKWLKPSIRVSRIGDRASVQACVYRKPYPDLSNDRIG